MRVPTCRSPAARVPERTRSVAVAARRRVAELELLRYQ